MKPRSLPVKTYGNYLANEMSGQQDCIIFVFISIVHNKFMLQVRFDFRLNFLT